jgi:hypothetical protein
MALSELDIDIVRPRSFEAAPPIEDDFRPGGGERAGDAQADPTRRARYQRHFATSASRLLIFSGRCSWLTDSSFEVGCSDVKDNGGSRNYALIRFDDEMMTWPGRGTGLNKADKV